MNEQYYNLPVEVSASLVIHQIFEGTKVKITEQCLELCQYVVHVHVHTKIFVASLEEHYICDIVFHHFTKTTAHQQVTF